MALNDSYIDYIVEKLEPLGTISTKRMFGGCGIFCDGRMMCKISPSEIVSLKANDDSAKIFRNAGMAKSGKMNYYELSPDQLEDDIVFLDFARLAQAAAVASGI